MLCGTDRPTRLRTPARREDCRRKGQRCSRAFDTVDFERQRPGGGMAYAGDLKSPVPYGTCGFDPHPGHHFLCFVFTTCPGVGEAGGRVAFDCNCTICVPPVGLLRIRQVLTAAPAVPRLYPCRRCFSTSESHERRRRGRSSIGAWRRAPPALRCRRGLEVRSAPEVRISPAPGPRDLRLAWH